ncbi:MAG TPA: ATP-binding protein, partial [Spirochaetia bacterium]|nr:ATP-binding protein [Spirochaetia bacterium]
HDITREQLLESQLRQAQKMESIGRLAGGVAHDFNNMLQVISSYVEISLKHSRPGEKLFTNLQQISAAARRSADLTGQLLAFARRQAVNPRVLDLNEAVAGTLKMLRRLIGEDVDLVWKPGAAVGNVKIDPSQLDQVLANLAVNARDAIDGVGKLVIETGAVTLDETTVTEHPGSTPGTYSSLSVSDSGRGMDREVLSHIFEPFYTTKETGRGTGLGLATVYGVVKQNSGFINVYSEPGMGTTFRIYLPIADGKALGKQAEGASVQTHGGNETILLVEDEEAILNLSRQLLQDLGYSVLASRTPDEAIRLARSNPSSVDLLITDVVMPQMNGRQLAASISTIAPRAKCLYMSGYTADVIAHQGLLDKGVNFIAKPFSMTDLASKIRAVLDEKQ